MVSTPGNLMNGKHRLFDGDMVDLAFFCEANFLQGFSGHDSCCEFRERDANCFTDEGNRAGGTWIDLQHINIAALDCELNIDQSHDPQFQGQAFGLFFDLRHDAR